MGGSSVDANVLGVRFSDNTYQNTSATASAGNSITQDVTGILATDVFGNILNMTNGAVSLGVAGSGGGFSSFFDGTNYGTAMSDGQGNALLLGLSFGNNFNLSNESLSSGIVNPSGALTNIYGTPVNIIGTLEVNGVPVGGGQVTKAQRVHVGVIASATPSAITTLTWTAPFADNNYTVTASVEIAETPPNGAATEIITVGSMQKSAAGAGVTFVVCNASSGVHDVTVDFIAVHD
jgi:hypothetical protein